MLDDAMRSLLLGVFRGRASLPVEGRLARGPSILGRVGHRPEGAVLMKHEIEGVVMRGICR